MFGHSEITIMETCFNYQIEHVNTRSGYVITFQFSYDLCELIQSEMFFFGVLLFQRGTPNKNPRKEDKNSFFV